MTPLITETALADDDCDAALIITQKRIVVPRWIDDASSATSRREVDMAESKLVIDVVHVGEAFAQAGLDNTVLQSVH